MGNCAFFILLLLAMSGMWSGKATKEDVRKPYIVHMIKSMKPQHFNLHQHWYSSMLSHVWGSDPTANANELLYTYDTLLYGFAARLSEAEAEAMEGKEGCLAVIPSSLDKVANTHTPEFLGLSSFSSSSPGLWSQYSTRGEDIIVGVIDYGILPEHESFNDAGLGPVPSRWKGTCESGRAFNSSHCNRKIIGARYFYKGYQNNQSKINETLEYMSPRDSQGHGTHVASTAAGAAVRGASLLGFANGTATGMAPRARLAIYKACWRDGCDSSDVAAAMEQAIADGVDILSISLHSADVPFHESLRAIAAFGATEKGVFVSAAAGNDGPDVYTLSHTAPWITTVGASGIDRDFPGSLVLGNQEILRGTSIFKGDGKLQGPFPLVYVSTSNSSKRCLDGSLDPNVVKGKLVLCDKLLYVSNGGADEVARAGGAGVILANGELLGAEQLLTNPNGLPVISVSFSDGEKIKSYINSRPNNVTATMRLQGLTIVGNATPAPTVASFSSRGPSEAYPSVLKPDIVAPGHVDRRAALDPGLVYDMAPQDYIDFLCSLNYTRRQISLLTEEPVSCPKSSLEAVDLNYPSFSVVFKTGNNSIKVFRRSVTNVGAEGNVVYRVSVKSPPGVNISVEPQMLVFKKL
ncbi:hypothetical protein SUGI_0572940 [Cryptomeria japonica]|nr:hypothetical protein SUGI_0572940 [Cryptomeria japonica]